MQISTQARRISAAALFWPLWWLTAALQVPDVASVWIGSAGHSITEFNPMLVALAAHFGVVGAMVVKTLTVGACLGLLARGYVLAQRRRDHALVAVCLVFVAAGALEVAVLVCSNAAIMVLGF